MLQTQLIHDHIAFDQLADEWDSLVGESMTNSPFQLLAYQRAWWTHLQPAGATLHTIAVRDDAGALVAIGSFYLLNGELHFNGCIEETDYLDLICRADDAEAAWAAVIDCLCSTEFPAWTALECCNVPAASMTRTVLPQLAASRGFLLHTEVQEVCPTIALPDSFADYVAGLDKKQRHETRRKLRRANGADAELKIVGPDDDIHAEVDDFLTLLQSSTSEKGAWLNDGRRALFHEVAAAAHARGTLELLFFVVNGEKAAALFNFDYDGRVWVYNSGLAPDAYGHLSAGVVLTAWSIEQAIEKGRSEFDFLRGNESYKYKFGAEDSEIFRVRLEPASAS